MTPGEQVSILEHMDRQFAHVADDIRGVYHHLGEMEQRNSREHGRVVEALEDVAGRVDVVERHVDEKRGAAEFRRSVAAVVAGVIAAAAGIAAIAVAVIAVSSQL